MSGPGSSGPGSHHRILSADEVPAASDLLDKVLAETDSEEAPAWLPIAREVVRANPGPPTSAGAAALVDVALADWFRATRVGPPHREGLCQRIADTVLSHPAASARFAAWWARLGRP